MKKLTKSISVGNTITFVVISALGYGIGNYFYNLALNPKSDKSVILKALHNEISIDDDGINDNSDVKMSDEKWFKTIGYQENYIQSYDGLKLHSYIIKNENHSNKWIIIVHGYSGKATLMTRAAKKFYEMGFNILLPDARGHGESEGSYIGMGWHDRLDIISWIGEINANYDDANIILYGVSMGGATVMMASGEKLPSNVKAIVEDCGYSSVKEEFAYQLKELFGFPSFPILNFANIVTNFRAGYTLGEASATKQVAKSTTPILFIHGDSDTFVPSYMLDKVYEAANVEKEKLVVEGAGHGNAASVAGELYWNTIKNFINKYLD